MFSFLSRIRKPRRAESSDAPAGGRPATLSVVDMLAAAVTAEPQTEEPSRDTLLEARKLLEQHVASADPHGAVPRLMEYVRRYPETELFQVLVARSLEAAHKPDESLAVWRSIHQRFPDSSDAFILMLRGVKRQLGVDAARGELELYFAGGSTSARDILLEAKSWDEIGNAENAEACFARLVQEHPGFENGYVSWAQSLVRRGALWRARSVLRNGAGALGDAGRKVARRLGELDNDIAALRLLGVDGEGRDVPVSILVLERLFQEIGKRRNAEYDAGPESFVGTVLMINGSLGAGGAERQFVNTAVALQTAIQSGNSIAGYGVVGPVQVVCRSLRSREGADFFAATLRDNGIPVSVYADMQAWGGCEYSSLLAPYREYLRFLPKQIIEGTTKLTDVMRSSVPQVVHIWQDGSIFATALAALLAGVPRIVLSVRTMPPVDRPDRYRVEYDTIYSELLKMRGVVLSSNSQFAAHRYAEWLNVDARRIPVVYNGLAPLKPNSDETALGMMAQFNARTPDQTFTVGTVMRVDDNKRPFLWVEAAQKFAATHPHARFVMVGGGPLLEPVKEFAQRIGMADRILFTGLSKRVGYWLTQFDAFLLLSRFEGLPNVLIEAQFSGVPVVTTLAGGAGEAVQEGVTGLTLPADTVTADDVAQALTRLHEMRQADAQIAERARQWATARFSLSQMIASTVRCYQTP
ncbi:Vi polysaccharide biosynthesis protein TviE [Bordetella genomosp. 1]|uniref:Vi polysaccharide biosynthesis protein TviE n=1 Tax=Bordetella genomosp. 1 TaxID=1395607 RepID=A0A261SE89_9BORD|nr:glycosyltransferase [Bordetella genomosp. 1]OZI35719.1 Vi polysaccharide biosynthesis protein TviE [Bordetella genomosp. 1]OZI58386.1 Vi polysaccharide biosynthesis protein TviE [Bordetella genomosp. 1]